MYRVLATRPTTEKSGEVTRTPDGDEIKWHRVIGWTELGTAKDMQEARAKFGGHPALEWIGPIH